MSEITNEPLGTDSEDTAELPVSEDGASIETPTTPAAESPDATDYEALMISDLEELKREFSELSEVGSITEIKNPLRYAALRDLGLTPKEAYLATAGKRDTRDNRSHLSYSAPKSAGAPACGMTRYELEGARELFYGMSDSEIKRLYQKVTR